VREDGIVYLMNRRGETLKNFPLNLDARPLGAYAVETGNSNTAASFVLVSREGFRIKFDVDGKIISRESLIKTTPEARFSMVLEEHGKAYLIIRQEARQLTIMNEELKEIIASDFVGNNPVDIRYDDFGGGKVYITITDKSQDLSFIYDGQGKLLTTLPLESNAMAVRPMRQAKLQTYSSLGHSLTMQPL